MKRLLVVGLLFVLSWILYLDRAAISSAKGAGAGDPSLTDEAGFSNQSYLSREPQPLYS